MPEAYRFRRLEALLAGSDFAKKINVRQMATHAGFIPENPSTNEYAGVLAALRVVVKRCADNSQSFLFETGQETPVTLLRVIEDLGGENVGINLDPANLLMYGKANPVDALDVFGKYVRDVHAKDGEYPVGGRFLGEEKPLGSGRVNFPAFIKKLKTIGYDGPITIEREISGEKQRQDILKAISTLKELIG
ncbi:MAG: sugar phosphate isomerase/epimerase [Defluviitaleaceae bacterium]|nr:sugar phosphate isomerase/epimerase [Defluviitaleaceae bacterium]